MAQTNVTQFASELKMPAAILLEHAFVDTAGRSPLAIPEPLRSTGDSGSYIVEWNIQMAGSLIAALPTLLVYIFLGRFFLRGLMAGSLKG